MLKMRGKRVNYIYIPILLWLTVEYYRFIPNIEGHILPPLMSNILSIIFIYLFFILFCAISKSTFRGTLITSILLLTLVLTNQIKIAYSTEPIYIKDIRFFNSPNTIGDILNGTFIPILKALLKETLVFLKFATLICIISKIFEQKYVSNKKRSIVAAVTVAMFVFMFLPIYKVNDLFLNVFLDCSGPKTTIAYTTYYEQHGFFAGMYGQYLSTMTREPEGYDSEEIVEMLDGTKEPVQDSNKKKPNIIMVFSESFWDIDKQDTVKFSKPITSNYNKLKENGFYADMISPTFGTLSCNIEYEVLTGGDLTYYPECYIPYMDMYDSESYRYAPSVIKELKNNGYETHIASPWGATLYNCYKVYDYMGVDDVKYIDDFEGAPKVWNYITDDYLADNVINTLNTKDKSKPMFHMTLTAEAHMPYLESKFSNYSFDIESSPLSKEKTDVVKACAQGLHNADAMLGKLYDYIQSFDEPTILIFYGDHLPYLKTSAGEDIYQDMNYFNTDNEAINTFRKYNTGCLILDNYGLNYEKKDYMSPYLIMPYVFNHIDINVSPYYRWLYETMDKYPANNKYVSINSKGEPVLNNNLKDETSEQFSKELAKMNWYMFIDQPKKGKKFKY